MRTETGSASESGDGSTRAVVVGGTHGIGLATAKALVERGSRIVVTGRDATNAGRAQSELGDAATVVRSDVSSVADIDALGDLVATALGQVEAVFVFAGVAELEPFDTVTEASFDRQFAVNARGTFFAAQRLVPLVVAGGSITLTTVTPATASPAMAVYTGTKAAVRAFARVLAAELLERRIRVNSVAPGFVDTPTLGVAGLSAAERAELHAVGDQVTPMKRHGTPEEVARAALFLAFDATFTTGVDLAVDGGISTVDSPD